MPGVLFADGILDMNESCWSLREYDEVVDGKAGRYRHIIVVRNDTLTDFPERIGEPGSPPFIIPGGVQDERTHRRTILETVGRLLDMADTIRTRPHDYNDPRVHQAGPGLDVEYFNREERRRVIARGGIGRKVFGYESNHTR
jgi:hypothetical protein